MRAKQQLQKDIQEKERKVVEHKEALLIRWVATLYTSQHRCLLSIVADAHFRHLPLPISNLEKFKNGANLLRDLESGLMVVMVRREKGAVEVRINPDFFDLLPPLIHKMTAVLHPAIERLQRFEAGGDLRLCRGCQTLRTQQEILFIGESCLCDLPQFQPVKGDPPKLARLTQLRSMLDDTAKLSVQINNLSSQIGLLYAQIQKLNRRKTTLYERFVKEHGLESPSPTLVDLSPKELLIAAYEEFTAAMRLHKVEELKMLRESRRHRSKTKNEAKEEGEVDSNTDSSSPLDSSSSTTCWFYEPYPHNSVQKEKCDSKQLQQVKAYMIKFHRNFTRNSLPYLKQVWQKQGEERNTQQEVHEE